VPAATPAPAPVRPQLTASAHTIDVGGTVVLDVRGAPGAVNDLLASTGRSNTHVIGTTTLDATGRVRWSLQPGETTAFVARSRAAGQTPDSAPVTITVRRTVTIGIRQTTASTRSPGVVARCVLLCKWEQLGCSAALSAGSCSG